MQTFLPYPNFVDSAKCLDRQRLGKQRVECLQILNALLGARSGWANHPAVKMWRNHETALAVYGWHMCEEWTGRGYKDTCKDKILKFIWDQPLTSEHYAAIVANPDMYTGFLPKWLGDDAFHASHRSNLLRKNYGHYSQFGWTEDPYLPYVWPA